MGVTARAAESFRLLKNTKKAYDYYVLLKGALDEDTRSGSLLKLGVKATMEVAKKTVGSTLTWHPYYTYHKAHFEALSQALNAVDMKTMATESFNRAVAAADSTGRVRLSVEEFAHRRNSLGWYWSWNLVELIALRNRHRTQPAAVLAEIKDVGLTPQSLETTIETSLYDWRAGWADLCVEVLGLYLMIDAEARIAEAAWARYQAKVKKLTEGSSSIGRIAGYAAEQDRLWQQYDRMKEGGAAGKAELAVSNPAAYAAAQRDIADLAARRYARACDIVLSDAVNTPNSLLQRIDEVMGSK